MAPVRAMCAVMALLALGLPARSRAADAPQLVVQVLVEGLSADGLELMAPAFGSDGFSRLAREGVEITDVDFGPGADAVAAAAIVATGAQPRLSGVAHATVFDPARRRVRPALADSALSVAHGEGTLSPQAVLVSTLADELAVASSGMGRIYSLGGDAQTATLMAGHAGNNAFWISDIDGRWTSGPYYQETPSAVASRNLRQSLAQRLDTLRWTPARDPRSYPGVNPAKAAYPFRHTFARNDRDRYRAFKASATGNTEVTDLATAVLAEMAANPRPDGVTEMVNVVYTLAPYAYAKDPDPRMETLDAYLRLDADLARLMRAIDTSGPGMDRTLLMVTGLPAPPASKRDDERFRIPHGRFSARKAKSLLNMYLMAMHGQGEWVTGYHNSQIHLNRALIERQGLELAEVRRQAASLLQRMAGVRAAITIDDIETADPALSRNIDPATAGDILLATAPGWETVDTDFEADAAPGARAMVARLAGLTYPAFIMAPEAAKGKRITGVTDARAIAPTLAKCLRIRAPNGAALRPLDLEAPTY